MVKIPLKICIILVFLCLQGAAIYLPVGEQTIARLIDFDITQYTDGYKILFLLVLGFIANIFYLIIVSITLVIFDFIFFRVNKLRRTKVNKLRRNRMLKKIYRMLKKIYSSFQKDKMLMENIFHGRLYDINVINIFKVFIIVLLLSLFIGFMIKFIF